MPQNETPAPSAPDRPDLIVKICGLTRLTDAQAALAAGADWLGFIRWPKSPRYQPIEALADLLAQLRAQAPRPFTAVGVYVDATRETIEREAELAGLDRIQLHGTETLEFARRLSRPALKAIRIRDAASIRQADDYEGLDLLTDTYDPALPGGTGVCYDFAMLRDLTARRRVLIAGGLHAGNVGAVVQGLKPWGVDASSGVESAPGIKDYEKLNAFIQAARQAAA